MYRELVPALAFFVSFGMVSFLAGGVAMMWLVWKSVK